MLISEIEYFLFPWCPECLDKEGLPDGQLDLLLAGLFTALALIQQIDYRETD